MTTYAQKVQEICDEVYIKMPQQILIDFVQEEVEEQVYKVDETGAVQPVARDSVGALGYTCGLLLEIYNPKFVWDIDVLTRLKAALKEWEDDIERTNKYLGLPKET